MMELIEKSYLTPPENEAKPVFKCFFCKEDIFEGEEFYFLNGFYCCKECLDLRFKFVAEASDYEAEQADIECHDLGR